MVEEDAAGGVHAVGLAVVDGHVVPEDLAHAVRRARPELRALGLGHLPDLAEHLRARRLVEADRAEVVLGVQPDRLEDGQGALGGDVGGVADVRPRVGDVGDGAEVVDLLRVGGAERADQAREVGQVAVVERDVGDQRADELELGVVLAADEPCTSYPLASKAWARYSPSCPVIPVMSALGMGWSLSPAVPVSDLGRALGRCQRRCRITLLRMKILVTGGAGYIGSTTAKALEEAGHVPVILDSLLTGPLAFVRDRIFYEGDIADRDLLAADRRRAPRPRRHHPHGRADRGPGVGGEALRVLPRQRREVAGAVRPAGDRWASRGCCSPRRPRSTRSRTTSR